MLGAFYLVQSCSTATVSKSIHLALFDKFHTQVPCGGDGESGGESGELVKKGLDGYFQWS